MNTYVIGDIHGEYDALIQCLQKANFDYNNDTLISLGDVVDRGPKSYFVIEELLKIKNLIPVKGNHDQVFKHWIDTGIHMFQWLHGGTETRVSYLLKEKNIDDDDVNINQSLSKLDIPESHVKFFESQLDYYLDSKDRLFVHGGFDRDYPLSEQDDNTFLWDRDLWNKALTCSKGQNLRTIEGFSEIYIGHTPTLHWKGFIDDEFGNKKMGDINYPMNSGGVWNMDTGACFTGGRLSMMNVNTKELFQSDVK